MLSEATSEVVEEPTFKLEPPKQLLLMLSEATSELAEEPPLTVEPAT